MPTGRVKYLIARNGVAQCGNADRVKSAVTYQRDEACGVVRGVRGERVARDDGAPFIRTAHEEPCVERELLARSALECNL